MRIILYTGKGGVGKTSIAAATAVRSARDGRKTLVVSTDAAHSLGDSLDIELSSEPVEIQPNLWAQEIDSVHEVEKGWGKVQSYLTTLLTAKTIQDITTEELTVFPGMEELMSLMRILGYYKEGTFDVMIIDCAPTGETLALLSFPEILRWWMDKLFPLKRRALKVVGPVIGPLLGVPMPSDGVMAEIEHMYNQLDEMRQVLSGRETSIRIVVNPEKMVIKEAQRSFTYLNLYEFNIDAVIVNRVIPDSVTDAYFQGWKDIQGRYKDLIADSFSPVPIYYVPLLENEVVGLDMLTRMGDELFHHQDAVEIKYEGRIQRVTKEKDGYTLSVYMPFVDKKDLSLNRKGDELIVRVGNVKRIITLPRILMNFSIQGATFSDETLFVRFGGERNV